MTVGISIELAELVDCPAISVAGTLKACCLVASDRAATIDEALGKRSAGSFARQRIMTVDNAGGRFGFIRDGEAGTVCTCCIMTAAGLLPRKGSVPVQSS